MSFNQLNHFPGFIVFFIPVVKKPNKGKVKAAVKKRKQEEPSSSQSLSTDNEPNKNKLSSKVRWLISHQKVFFLQVLPFLILMRDIVLYLIQGSVKTEL